MSSLDRLRAAFEVERGFAANAAHELRTPLAGTIAQALRPDRRTSSSTTCGLVQRAPVVPTEALAHLTDRFERGASDLGGSGLGLALVASWPRLRSASDAGWS